MDNSILPACEIIKEIQISETDFLGRWKPSCIYTAMQEIADTHAHNLGCGRSAMVSRGIVWVLTRLVIEMRRYPHWGETVRLYTWAYDRGGRLFPRNFRIFDESGEEIGAAASIWIIMDMETRKVLRAPDDLFHYSEAADKSDPLPSPQQLRPDKQLGRFSVRKPVYSDLDVNFHMNNARYVEWICDMFDTKKHKENFLHTLQVNYLTEAVPDKEIELSLLEENDEFFVRGNDAADGTAVFEAFGKWKRE